MCVKMADVVALKNALENELNILIISPNKHLLDISQENLYETWHGQQTKRLYGCKIHKTSNLSSVTETLNTPVKFFDFYVFLIEPKFINCLNEVEENLKHLGEKYGRQKVCLVAIGVNYNTAVVKPEELWTFAQIYQFNLIMGDFKTPEKAGHLCNRILNLCEMACGIHIGGIPLVGKV